MDKFFKYTERGSSLSTEIIAGITTFLTMAYIIFVNPNILSLSDIKGLPLGTAVPFTGALTATCIGAAVMCIAMGIFANRPIALASGMGINAIVAYTLILGMKVPWQVAMGVVFVEGIIITVLVLVGLREAIMNAIPVGLRRAIAVGIGLFIAFIGLKSGGIIVANDSTLVALGDFTSKTVWVAFIGLAITAIMMAFKIKGDFLIGIIVAAIASILLGVSRIPTSIVALPDFSTFAAPFQRVNGSIALVQVFTPVLLLFVFSILMTDFFDTMGTVVGIGEEAGFVDKEGNVEDVRSILLVDSAAAAVGGFMGASSITSYVESASGVGEGGRTGITVIVAGLLFLVAVFFSPLLGVVSSAATAGALITVGFLMMSPVKNIDWNDMEIGFPAFMTIIAIPLTYSITNGIGLGFISFVVIKLCRGKFSEIKPLMWVASVAFLLVFLQAPLLALVSK
ncbi:MAG: NCS2 family permease [Coriobacteriia bacterium]|nr:NCS2 family permease [Coriobacteriia bacterium]